MKENNAFSQNVSYFDTNNIEYLYENPTKEQLIEWTNKYRSLCSSLIKINGRGYDIPRDMRENHPCLVYLILNSRSLESHSDKQKWFDLYSLMNVEQIDNLYGVLYKEKRKFLAIEMKYNEKKQEIERKYSGQQNQ